MSNQGNIVVESEKGIRYIFTSWRWSGPSMPRVAQEALREALTARLDKQPWRDERDCMANIVKNDNIYGPVFEIGNCDVPIVLISFKSNTVSFFSENEESKPLKVFTFEQYAPFQLRLNKEIQEWFE